MNSELRKVMSIIELDSCDKLRELLESWDLIELLPHLQKAEITFRSLKFLSKDDVKQAISSVGLHAEFRESLFSWKKEKFNIDDDTISVDSNVLDWVKDIASNSPSASSTSISLSQTSSIFPVDLTDFLNKTTKGQAIIQFYKENGFLLENNRRDLINIIVEEINYSKKTLRPSDFPELTQKIITTFPTELKEYYFVPRKLKKNPGGKLCDKYVNFRTKLKKFNPETHADISTNANLERDTLTEIDESVAQALKSALVRNSSDWQLVRDPWEKPFSLRKKELLAASFSSSEFLNSWPSLKDSRAAELIEIDFKLLYPGKEQCLFSKWDSFKSKIKSYYSLYIKDRSSKELLKDVDGINSIHSEDYVYTTLLNSIILPSGRFKDKSGRNKRKVTIKEAEN